jgi:cell wall-associated NlpC family hydrolase
MAILDETVSWLNTPWQHRQAVKGAGVDCALLIKHVYLNCGLVPDFPVMKYSSQWYLHHSEEVLKSVVERFAVEVSEALPGDVVLYRVGRCLAHAAIVVEWPLIIHAWRPAGSVCYSDALQFRRREKVFYRLRGLV